MSRGQNRVTRRRSESRSRRSPPVSDPEPWPRPLVVAGVLAAYTAIFIGLQVGAYTRWSATFDEPGSLVAGYAAIAEGDYRPAIEHPPLTRMWAALALLTLPKITYDSKAIDLVKPEAMAFQGPFELGHRFLYKENDADRLLYRARLMNVSLGVLLGLFLFAWMGEWLGFRAAVAALILYTVEPNIAAHSSLVTTDVGVACFMFATTYFLWRASRKLTPWDVAGMVVCFVLAVLSKFSALILGPVVAVLMALAIWRGRTFTVRSAIKIVSVLVAATVLGSWAVYGFRYAPSAATEWVFTLHDHPAVRQAVPALASIVSWIDGHRLLPNALTQGFLHGQGLVQGRPSFLMGEYSSFGWWYYFPVAFVLKTSIALLVLFAIGVITTINRGRLLALDGEAFVIVPVVLFMAAAMTSALNIGLRHILPIYPFAIMLAVLGLRATVSGSWRRAIPVGLALVLGAVLEFASVYPNNLAFFNRLAGGPSNGFRYLADSNLDWGQDLKVLKGWMDRNKVAHINLAYFGVADPAYYGIECTYMGGTTIPGVTPAMMKAPRLPGYVAISTTLLSGVPFSPRDRDFYKPLRPRIPAAILGGSIRVYWVEKGWW